MGKFKKLGNGNGTNGSGKRANGRPTLYKPIYVEQLLEHMASGLSFESFVSIAKCSSSALESWAREHEEFKSAKKEGRKLGKIFWETLGLNIAQGMGPRLLKTRTIKTITRRITPKEGDPYELTETTETETYGAAQGNTAAWIFNMINRYPADWKQRSAHEHTGKDGGPIKTENKAEDFTDDTLRKIQSAIVAEQNSS